MSEASDRKLDLALVMPVYNEEECAARVVRSWRDMLAGLGIRFRMIVLNDGSTDGTAEALAVFAADGRVQVIDKPNSGHGPTILEGYRLAVKAADWVFQCDSDDEMGPEHFPEFWQAKEGYDALFGVRSGRFQGLARRLLSAGSRRTVALFFRKGVADVNTPYRLMRAGLLARIVDQIPPDTFAPNVIVSGTLARARVRIWNHLVPHRARRTGAASIASRKVWRLAWRTFWQTVKCRPRLVMPRGRRRP